MSEMKIDTFGQEEVIQINARIYVKVNYILLISGKYSVQKNFMIK